MKQELKNHLIPVLAVFVFISIFWIFRSVPFLRYVELLSGFAIGAFLLDSDHLIYWFYLKPNLEESRIAQMALKNKDYKSLIKLITITHKTHTNLVFHHYFFQIVLFLISLFVFTSTTSVFTRALMLSLNLHLLIDEVFDYYYHPHHLQNWLFAREEKQLSIFHLKYYLLAFAILLGIFVLQLIRFNL